MQSFGRRKAGEKLLKGGPKDHFWKFLPNIKGSHLLYKNDVSFYELDFYMI
jgi:hypothetical protein